MGYGNVVRASRYACDTDKVEKERSTKLFDEIRHLTYEERLAKLKLHRCIIEEKEGT